MLKTSTAFGPAAVYSVQPTVSLLELRQKKQQPCFGQTAAVAETAPAPAELPTPAPRKTSPSLWISLLKKAAYGASFLLPIANVPGAIRHITESNGDLSHLTMDIVGELIIPGRSWAEAAIRILNG